MNQKEKKGLTAEEARQRLQQFGPNQIFQPSRISFFGIARHEVTEPMILLLLVVGIVYSLWGKLADAITIFAVIFLLVLAEVYNEYRPQNQSSQGRSDNRNRVGGGGSWRSSDLNSRHQDSG